MSRFGDNSTRGENENRIRNTYVAGATAAGAATAGVGGRMVYTGNRAQQRGTAMVNRITAQMDGPLKARNERARTFSAKQGRMIRLSEAGKKQIREAAPVVRVQQRATALDEAVQFGSRRALKGHMTRALRDPAYADAVDRYGRLSGVSAARASRKAVSDAQIRNTNRAADLLSRTRVDARRTASAGRLKALRGKGAIAVGASLPLAALASRNKVAREWAGGAPAKDPASTPVRAVPKSTTHKYLPVPLKRVVGEAELTDEQKAKVKAALQDKGWDLSAQERRDYNRKILTRGGQL